MPDAVATTSKSKTSTTDNTKRAEVTVPARKVVQLILHCAATPDGKHFTVTNIDSWHRERGWYRRASYKKLLNPDLTSIGYHYVIYTDGSVHTGRHEAESGAHTIGQNADSLGVCLIGTRKFYAAQWTSLASVVAELEGKHPIEKIAGHNEYAAKECPGFKVPEWLEGGRKALDKHLLEEPKPANPATPTSGPQ
jgi:N-acetyl-anhydromuramyl-L-alanine amidase AmpD